MTTTNVTQSLLNNIICTNTMQVLFNSSNTITDIPSWFVWFLVALLVGFVAFAVWVYWDLWVR